MQKKNIKHFKIFAITVLKLCFELYCFIPEAIVSAFGALMTCITMVLCIALLYKKNALGLPTTCINHLESLFKVLLGNLEEGNIPPDNVLNRFVQHV